MIDLAGSLKIHPDDLKRYAAFHNESHHPHVHMICYSTNPNEGYLTKAGIHKMKSALASDLGRMNADGLGCSKDVDKSHQWYEKGEAIIYRLLRFNL